MTHSDHSPHRPDNPLAEIAFTAPVIYWRGPSPFHFIVVPEALAGEIHYAAREVSYGWGMVPAQVIIGGVQFATALFPKNGTYYLPLRDKVRAEAGLLLGEEAAVHLYVVRRASTP